MKLATLALSLAVAVIALVAVESASAQGYGQSIPGNHSSVYSIRALLGQSPNPNLCRIGEPRPSVPVWGSQTPYQQFPTQLEVMPRPYLPRCGNDPRPPLPRFGGNDPRPLLPRCGNDPRPQVYGSSGLNPYQQPVYTPSPVDPFAP